MHAPALHESLHTHRAPYTDRDLSGVPGCHAPDGFASAHREPRCRPLVGHATSQPHRIAQTLFRPVVDLHPTATRSRPQGIVVVRHDDPTSGGVVFSVRRPRRHPSPQISSRNVSSPKATKVSGLIRCASNSQDSISGVPQHLRYRPLSRKPSERCALPFPYRSGPARRPVRDSRRGYR